MGPRKVPEGGGWLTVAEVAGRLKVSKATVYKLVDAGFLPHSRIGNSIRIAEAALARLAEMSFGEVCADATAPAKTPRREPEGLGTSALEALEKLL